LLSRKKKEKKNGGKNGGKKKIEKNGVREHSCDIFLPEMQASIKT